MMKRRDRKLIIQTAALGTAITVLVMLVDAVGGLTALERWFYDRRLQDCQFFAPPPTDKLVHLDIDDQVLELLGAWPWPRSKLGLIVDEVREAGARVLALDVILPEKQAVELRRAPDESIVEIDHDAVFARSLREFGKVLVPISFATPTPHTRVFDAMRAICIENVEISEDDMLRRLQDMNLPVVSITNGEDSTRFVRARMEAMFHLVKIALSEQPDITLEALRARVTPRAAAEGVRNAQVRLLEKQYEKNLSLRAISRHTLSEWHVDADVLKVETEMPPIRVLCEASNATGFVYYEADPDGLVRSIVLFANHDGQLWPQMGLSLACQYLGVELAEVQIARDRVTIPRLDGKDIVIPVHRRRVRMTGQNSDLNMLLPWFGAQEGWDTMYDPGRRTSDRHVPLSKVWSIVEVRERIEKNNAQVDDAILAIWDTVAPAKRMQYESNRLPLNDSLARLPVMAEVLKDVDDTGFMDIYAQMTPEELEKDTASLIFVRSVKALRSAIKEVPELEDSLKERKQWLRHQLADRAVLIGWTGTGVIADFVPTPLHSKCPGVVVHGLVFNAILTGDFWRTMPHGLTAGLTLLLGLLTTAALCRFTPVAASVMVVSLILSYFVVNGILLFDYGNLIIGVAGPLTGVLGVWSGCMLFRFVIERAERARITRRFSNYVDPALVDYVIEHPEEIRLEGKKKELTVVFTDLAGFTTLTEKMGEKSVSILNEYTELMVPIISSQKGYVNKFMGDGMMFFYGAPQDNHYHALDAVITAIRIQEIMVLFNASLTERGLPNVSVRVGVGAGPMIVGDAGSTQRSDYTVIGDVVNLAARLESANKYTGTSIMVNEQCTTYLGDQFLLRPVGRLQVVGKNEYVMTYEPLCRSDNASDDQRRMAAMSGAVVDAFVASNFAACITAVDAYQAAFGEMKLMKLYRKLAEAYQDQGPPDGFMGQIVLESK